MVRTATKINLNNLWRKAMKNVAKEILWSIFLNKVANFGRRVKKSPPVNVVSANKAAIAHTTAFFVGVMSYISYVSMILELVYRFGVYMPFSMNSAYIMLTFMFLVYLTGLYWAFFPTKEEKDNLGFCKHFLRGLSASISAAILAFITFFIFLEFYN